MRALKLILMLVMGVTLMIPCISKAEEAKEAKDVKELIKMYDSKECETCHADYVADWKHSLHSKPLIGPFGKTLGTLQGYLKEREDTVKEKDKPERPGELRKSKEVTKSIKEFMMPCFICHIPQLQDASEQAAQQIADAVLKEDDEILEELTINCLICHNRQALPRKYRDGNPEKDAIYGVNKTGKHQAPSYPKMIKSEMMKDPAFCGGCHQGPNVLHSAEPMWCVSNYDSYLQSYIPQGGDKTCQNCHMEKTDYNKTGHRFPPNYDDKELSYKRLRDSIKFDVSAMAYIFQIKTPKLQSIPKAIVRTKVSHNVAHRFPDGCPSPTHFLLEVSIKDKDGKELQKYTKYYMPQKKLGYDENKMVFASLRKLSLMRDTSLQPFKDNVEEFEYDLPEGVKDIKVEAKLTFIVEPGVDSSIFELYKVEKEAHIGEPKEAAK